MTDERQQFQNHVSALNRVNQQAIKHMTPGELITANVNALAVVICNAAPTKKERNQLVRQMRKMVPNVVRKIWGEVVKLRGE